MLHSCSVSDRITYFMMLKTIAKDWKGINKLLTVSLSASGFFGGETENAPLQ